MKFRKDNNMSITNEKRSSILELLSKQLKSWDGTSEHADKIVTQNKPLLFKLKQIDDVFSQQSQDGYSEAEQQQVAEIIAAQRSLLAVIKQDRSAILDKMKQVNQKNKIVDNYYSAFQQSIFVDKGM